MKDDRVYFWHVRDAIERILNYTAGGRKAFFSETMIQDAVMRNIEVMGEAVKSVSERTRSFHPAIPWQEIARMRDKLIHDYLGVDLEVVWDVVERDIPDLKGKIETVLAEWEEGQ